MTKLDRLEIQLDALETALDVARREPRDQQRRRMLAAVRRAVVAARRDHNEHKRGQPHLRLLKGGGSGDNREPSYSGPRHFAARGIAVTAMIMATTGATLTFAPDGAQVGDSHSPAYSTTVPSMRAGEAVTGL